MKLIVLAATASVSSALGPLAPSVSARDMMPKKLGARWYTGYQTAYPNGAKDMPDAPPESTSATLGDHDPKLFNFWKQIHEQSDVYEVALARPLGIVFEEIAPLGAAPAGVKVIEVSEGSNAEKAGCVVVGDVLVGVTGVRYPGSAYLGAAKPERDIFPAHEMNFDQVVEAIGSNEPPECDDVILRLRRAA